MTLWARLTWQTADPSALAADLERRLGITGRDGGLVLGARLLDLGSAELEVRPWVREGPADRPRRAGRLMLEPVPGGEPEPSPVLGVVPPPALLALGWATVDLDRAEADLDMWLALDQGPVEGIEPSLGATTRVRGTRGLPGTWIVLLEPVTEGRVAAALARDDEGPCALYLQPPAGLDDWLAEAASRGVETRSGIRRDGPFGRQALLAGGPAAGPHIVMVEGLRPSPVIGATGTIRA